MYKFSFEPKKVSDNFYQEARQQIVEYYSSNKDVLSIYEYGSVSSPGVSDLDIILILNDQVKTHESFFDFSNISKNVHSLVADGTVMKMSEENFSKLSYLDNKIITNKLYGKDLKRIEISKHDQSILDLISVVDWLPERILRLTKAINSNSINITMILCVLHSFSYSLKRINNLISKSTNKFGIDSYETMTKKISVLRNNWHELENPEANLIECIKDAITLGYTYLDAFEMYLKDNKYYSFEHEALTYEINLELYKNHYLKFINTNNIKKELIAQNLSKGEKCYVLISDYFFQHFYFLSNQSGHLSSVMKTKMSPMYELKGNTLEKDYERILHRKLSIAESNAQFLINNSMKKGLIRYGFHFKN